MTEGKAILAHPAGKAVIAAGKLLKAGKLAEVKRASAKEAREEWAATSAADQRAEAEEAAKSAPDTATLEAEIARGGTLIDYGDSAMLRTESADGNSTIVAFVSLEDRRAEVDRHDAGRGDRAGDRRRSDPRARDRQGGARLRQGDLRRQARRCAGMAQRPGA